MSVVGSAGLLCIFAVSHWFIGKPVIASVGIHQTVRIRDSSLLSCCVGCTNADRFTNGFPNVLVAEVFLDKSTSHTLRLIPEMTFTCNGTIVGFTVAGRQQTKQQTTQFMNPNVQIWRQNSSQNVYYHTNLSEIAIDEDECFESFIVLQGSTDKDQVWYCNLSAANRVPVQAGDVLGLLLPPREQSSFQISFASVSRGPTNYVFENDQEMLSTYANLSNVVSINYHLPQISVQVESDSGKIFVTLLH